MNINLKLIFKKSIFLKYIIPIYFVGYILLGIFLRLVTNSNMNYYDNQNIVVNLIQLSSPILIAPVVEEFVYRFWIKDFKIRYFFLKLIMLLVAFYTLLENVIQFKFEFFIDTYSQMQFWFVNQLGFSWLLYIQYDFVRFSVIGIVCLYLIFNTKIHAIENKFRKINFFNFIENNIFIYVSAFIFSYAHQERYDNLIVFIFLFIDGILLGYTRKFLSFKLAIIFHSLANTIIILLNAIFSENKNINQNIILSICIFQIILLIVFYINQSKSILKKL